MAYLRKLPIFIFVLASLWYVGLFCIYNQEPIRAQFPYIGNFNMPSSSIFLISFLGGAIFAAFFFGFDALRKSFSLRKSHKQLTKLQKEATTTDLKKVLPKEEPTIN